MGFEIGDRTFRGCYALDGTDEDEIEDQPGLYAIVCCRGNEHYLVDLGESSSVKSAVENNGRKDTWRQSCSGTLAVSVHYTSVQQSERMQIKREILAALILENRHGV